MKDLKRVLVGGLGTAALTAAMFAVSVPANAGGGRAAYGDGVTYGDQYAGWQEGANHYSRQHPDSMAFDGRPDVYGPREAYDPAYGPNVVGGVVGGAVAGAGAVVGGTLDGAGAVVGAPYHRNAAGYYGDGGGYNYGGQQYVRRGAYLYPVGPGANGPGVNGPGAY